MDWPFEEAFEPAAASSFAGEQHASKQSVTRFSFHVKFLWVLNLLKSPFWRLLRKELEQLEVQRRNAQLPS